MPQKKSMFADWSPKVKDQITRCVWVNYNEDSAARDTIWIQTSNTKPQKKIITKYLSYKDRIKYGLAMEHSYKRLRAR